MRKTNQGVLALFARMIMGSVILFSFSQPVYAFGDGEDEGDNGSQVSDVAADNSDTANVDVLGPFGGNVWNIAIDTDADMVYVTAKDSPNGIYRSADGGATWEGIEGGFDYGQGIAVDVDATAGDVYALFTNGLYVSTDQGATYTQVAEVYGSSLLVGSEAILIGSTDSDSPGVISRSTDNGTTFSDVTVTSDDQYFYTIAEGPTTGLIYAVGFDSDDATHLYRSTNSGSSWSEVTIPSITGTSNGSTIAVDPTDADHLILTGGYDGTSYQSTNAGSSWTSITPQSQEAAFDSSGRIFIGGQYSDDGSTWTSMGMDENDNSTAIGGHALLVDPNDQDTIYADGMPGLSKSTDRGVSWTDINEGIAGVTMTDISQANDKDIVWAAAYNGLAKTENFTSGNPTWEFPVLPDPCSAIWVEPVDAQIVVVGELGALKRSTDGGETWSEDLVSGLIESSMNVNEIIADVDTPTTLYAAVGNGNPSLPKTGMVIKSTDSGATWEDMEITDNASGQTLSQSGDGSIYVGLGAEGGTENVAGIYKYSDGSWSFLENSPDEEIVKVLVDPQDDNSVYAVASIAYGNDNTGNFGFYKSTDAGANWTKITENLDRLSEFNSLALQESTTPSTLYLGAVNYYGQGELYKSSDAGDTWGLLYTGLKEETFYTMIFDGVTAGTSRGLFDIKSKASLTLKLGSKKIKKNKKAALTLTLKDAVTDKALKNKHVMLFKKKGKKFVKIQTLTTKKSGKVSIKLRVKKVGKTQFKARWKPAGIQAEEYTTSNSSVKKLTVKKKKKS